MKTYIYVVNVKDLRLEEEPQSFGLLDGVSQLTVRLKISKCKITGMVRQLKKDFLTMSSPKNKPDKSTFIINC